MIPTVSPRGARRALVVLSLGLAAALAGSALAGPAGRTPLDRNGDGAIDRGEAAARPRLAERFDRLDRNRDGRLERVELRAQRAHHPGPRMRHVRKQIARADLDRDGQLSRTEAQALPRLAQRFDRLDRNGDGYLARGELRRRRR
ncbi:MAG TPA: EF-hand domain-containing protein [Lysobacter sp.]|nr:EF-hand domain-containing protein [Lysobacter sp.]